MGHYLENLYKPDPDHPVRQALSTRHNFRVIIERLNNLVKVVTMADGDTTPDISGGDIFISQANTGATEITDLDNPAVGQIVTIIVGSATNPPTITDGGNFKLSAGWSPNLDDTIQLFVKADNYYIELSRSAN